MAIIKKVTPLLSNNSTLYQHRAEAINQIETASENLARQVQELLPKSAPLWNNILFNPIIILIKDLRLKLAPIVLQFNQRTNLHAHLQFSLNNATSSTKKEISYQSDEAKAAILTTPETLHTIKTIQSAISSPPSSYDKPTPTYPNSTLVSRHSPIISNNSENQPLLPTEQEGATHSPSDNNKAKNKRFCCVII